MKVGMIILFSCMSLGFFVDFILKKNKSIAKRKNISESNLLHNYESRFGSIDEDIFFKSLSKVSEIFSVPIGKIRLDDTIGYDLGKRQFSELDSIEAEDFYEYINEVLVDYNASYSDPINTVSEFVKFNLYISRLDKEG